MSPRSLFEVNCTVHPSKVRASARFPSSRSLCKTPVIALLDRHGRATSTLERDAVRTKGICETPDVYDEAGKYPAIDEDHLVELLRHAERNWKAEYAKASASPSVCERYMDKVLAEVVP